MDTAAHGGIVAVESNGAAAVGELPQRDEELLDRLRCEHRGGLIQDQQLRLGQQRTHDLDALAFADRQRVHRAQRVVGHRADALFREQRLDLGLRQPLAVERHPAAARDQLIDHLVTKNYYKPELLNRFDDLIIFHPLGPSELTAVAKLLLERLNQRLRVQGIELLVSPALLEYIVSGGSNRLFGARPMLRFIQDNIEQAIAKAIIAGQLKAGAKVDFNPTDNTIRELTP